MTDAEFRSLAFPLIRDDHDAANCPESPDVGGACIPCRLIAAGRHYCHDGTSPTANAAAPLNFAITGKFDPGPFLVCCSCCGGGPTPCTAPERCCVQRLAARFRAAMGGGYV